MAVTDTGGPLEAPVGMAVLSRMFDEFGKTIGFRDECVDAWPKRR